MWNVKKNLREIRSDQVDGPQRQTSIVRCTVTASGHLTLRPQSIKTQCRDTGM
jgi:hypothetical protein